MVQQILKFMENYHMVEKGDRVVAGVSGGADSICLLHVLNNLKREYGFTLTVVHVNHGIRGAEADRDEKYVKELCKSMGIEFYGYDYDVIRIAKEEGLSEEEAGRNVRYQSFLEVCKKNKCNKIAIAHNKNDNAETILFHLFRGSGMRGLCGIEPVRMIPADFGNITLIRPLLCVERKDIEKYLDKEGFTYLTDSTNLSDNYSRNRIRNRILTYAEREINAKTIDHIASAAAQLTEIEEFMEDYLTLRYKELVNEEERCFYIASEALSLQPPVIQKGVVLKILEKMAGKRKDLEAKHVLAALSLLHKQVGKQMQLPYGIIAEREYNNIKFYFRKKVPADQTEPMRPIQVKIPGRTIIKNFDKLLDTSIINYEKTESVPKSSCVKWLDYDKIENVVEIRTRREGDYIQVSGTGGHKKLKDYFIDQKIPRELRNSQLLITDGSHVIWIPGAGGRISEKYKVDENTTRILLMRMSDLEDEEDVR